MGSLLYQDGDIHFDVRVHGVSMGFRYRSQTRHFGGHVMAVRDPSQASHQPQSYGPANGLPASEAQTARLLSVSSTRLAKRIGLRRPASGWGDGARTRDVSRNSKLEGHN
jgi:hypothetical protein